MTNSPAYRKRYTYLRHNGIETSLIDAGPYRRHLQRLAALGWTLHAIEPVTGISDHGMSLIADGFHVACERATAAGIMRMPYTLAVPDAVDDQSFVPAEGAVRRIRALMVLGWKREAINERLTVINVDHLARDTYPVIKAYRWRDVAAIYEQLHMTLGDAPQGGRPQPHRRHRRDRPQRRRAPATAPARPLHQGREGRGPAAMAGGREVRGVAVRGVGVEAGALQGARRARGGRMKCLRFTLALPWLLAGDICHEVGYAVYGKRFWPHMKEETA